MESNLIEILKKRGFIEAVSSDEIANQKKLKVYCGFDPTGNSLHIGHLVAIMGLAWFKRAGHEIIPLVGGATGMIGDPSGKSKERSLLDEETINRNVQGIKKNIETVIGSEVAILNNQDWFKNFLFIDFLRDVGKYFRLGPMLSKDSVKIRLSSEEGLSFTEFCYQTLQGYDFLHLYENYGVTVQIGGADQWGNITAGIDLIHKVKGEEAFGITFILLTQANGQKFGKSEKGAIWLSPDKLSPYDFYQYLVRIDDRDVIKLLKVLTFIDLEEIGKIELSMTHEGYVPNSAQRRLAEEVTLIVHGKEGLELALKATLAASPGKDTPLDLESLKEWALKVSPFEEKKENIVGKKVIDLISELKIVSSKSDARKLIMNRGLSINNVKIQEVEKKILDEELIEGQYLVIGSGKKNRYLIEVK